MEKQKRRSVMVDQLSHERRDLHRAIVSLQSPLDLPTALTPSRMTSGARSQGPREKTALLLLDGEWHSPSGPTSTTQILMSSRVWPVGSPHGRWIAARPWEVRMLGDLLPRELRRLEGRHQMAVEVASDAEAA